MATDRSDKEELRMKKSLLKTKWTSCLKLQKKVTTKHTTHEYINENKVITSFLIYIYMIIKYILHILIYIKMVLYLQICKREHDVYR